MNGSVLLCDGDVGGLGKSTAATIVTEYLFDRGLPVLVIDADRRNPDVHRLFENVGDPSILTALIDLRDETGRSEMLSLLSENPKRTVVVNLPAGIGTELAEIQGLLDVALPDLQRRLSVLFMLGLSADSVNLLRYAMEAYGADNVTAVKNLVFGSDERFTIWNGSQTRAQLRNAGGREIYLPKLAAGIMTSTIKAHPAVRFRDAENLRYGDRVIVKRWLQDCYNALNAIAKEIGLEKQ